MNKKRVALCLMTLFLGIILWRGYSLRNKPSETIGQLAQKKSKIFKSLDFTKKETSNSISEQKRKPANQKVHNDFRPTRKRLNYKNTSNISTYHIELDSAQLQISARSEDGLNYQGRSYARVTNYFAMPANNYIPSADENVQKVAGHFLIERVDNESLPLGAMAIVKSKNGSGVAIFTGKLKIKFTDYAYLSDLSQILLSAGIEVDFDISEEMDYIKVVIIKLRSFHETMDTYHALKKEVGAGAIERVEIDLLEWLRH